MPAHKKKCAACTQRIHNTRTRAGTPPTLHHQHYHHQHYHHHHHTCTRTRTHTHDHTITRSHARAHAYARSHARSRGHDHTHACARSRSQTSQLSLDDCVCLLRGWLVAATASDCRCKEGGQGACVRACHKNGPMHKPTGRAIQNLSCDCNVGVSAITWADSPLWYVSTASWSASGS